MREKQENLNKIESNKEAVILATEISKNDFKKVFRYIFSKENSLIELYSNPIIVTLNDLQDLNNSILQKTAHYDIHGAIFDAVITFENQKSVQYGTWPHFIDSDWSSPEVLDQLILNWRFMIKCSNSDKPTLYVICIRLASSLKPQHFFQALFSKNPDDVDKIDFELVPMSCRIDFTDPLLSQEFMNIVSNWNKGRSTPEYIFPIMKKFKKHSNKITSILRFSIPIFSVAACVVYYWKKTATLDLSLPATTSLIVNSFLWLAGSGAILFITAALGYLISEYTEKYLGRFGFFSIFHLTKGDEKRQNILHAKSNNAFWKFIFSGVFAIVWNIAAFILCTIFFKMK